MSQKHKKPVTHERFKCRTCEENLETKNCLINHMITTHNQQGEIFSCDLCKFETSRKASLTMHLSKKHKEIEQLDGTNSDVEDTDTEEYWERDNMGQRYKRYLDVIKDINDSNLSKEEKEQETERALSERRDAYLERGWSKQQLERMPPWDSM